MLQNTTNIKTTRYVLAARMCGTRDKRGHPNTIPRTFRCRGSAETGSGGRLAARCWCKPIVVRSQRADILVNIDISHGGRYGFGAISVALEAKVV